MNRKLILFELGFALLVVSVLIYFASRESSNKPHSVRTPMDVDARARELDELWTQHVAKDPGSASGWRRLGEAKIALARSTGQHELYKDAEAAVRQSLAVQPKDNIDAEGVLATILSSRHKFRESLTLAEAILGRPDAPVWVLGVAADAAVSLGEYDQAENYLERYRAKEEGFAYWTRRAHLSWLNGDVKTARSLLEKARDKYDAVDPEPAAWVRVQVGILDLEAGKYSAARVHFEDSLRLCPNYYLAAEHLAETYEAEGNFSAARPLLESAIKVVREPHFLVRLAEIERQSGKTDAADNLMAEARRLLEDSWSKGDQAIAREYGEFLLDHPKGPEDRAKALELISIDAGMRSGVDTDHVLARAFQANQRLEEADQAAQRSLRLGTPRADYYLLAAEIAAARGDAKRAEDMRERARNLNPHALEG